jgi:hypothetical protein
MKSHDVINKMYQSVVEEGGFRIKTARARKLPGTLNDIMR